MNLDEAKKEFIYWSQLLNEKGFVSARSGNVSCKIAPDQLLISSHDCYLGHLRPQEVLWTDMNGCLREGSGEVTSERDLHLYIHNTFKDVRVVLHTHSPYTTAFFHYHTRLDIFSFEAQFYLGEVSVVPQETPTVTYIEPILKVLQDTNIVVLKNHGVVAVGATFKEAFSLIELLEEQARVNLLIKSQSHPPTPRLRKAGKVTRSQVEEKKGKKDTSIRKRYKMLSKEHRERLVEIVNTDIRARELGKKYDLTCTLAVKNQDTGESMRFCYEKGEIIRTDTSDEAEFVITGKAEILKKVFNRHIDPFVAQTQGKVKTKGDFSKMSKWYPVMVHTFKLWEQAPVE
jgi:L-fuculose-phosphate aldolase